MTDVVLVLTTVDSIGAAERIATALVDERLAACVTVSAPVHSTYRWAGAVERATEYQLVIKTARVQVDALETRLRQLHSYELPEFLVLPIAEGGAAYLEWVRSSTGESGTA
jgi:periplasmic divalent cation tolerance protein